MIENETLRKIISKGSNYREPKKVKKTRWEAKKMGLKESYYLIKKHLKNL